MACTRRLAPLVAVALGLALTASPQRATGQGLSPAALARVPARLALDRSIWAQPPGSPFSLQVSLQSVSGTPVRARADVPIEVHSTALASPRRATLRAGESAVQVGLEAPQAGSARIEVSAPGLAPASCVLLVHAPAPSRAAPPPPPPPPPRRAPAGGGAAALSRVPPPEPSPPVVAPVVAPALAATPRLLVNPEHVRPDAQGVWRATLKVALFAEGDRLVPAPDRLQILFTSKVGRLSSDLVAFAPGDALSPPIELTSTVDGTDHVQALTPLGAAAAEVAYDRAPPVRLALHAPARVPSTGGGAQAELDVLLVADDGTPAAYSDRDLTVRLETSVGDVDPPALTIPRGNVGGAATLRAARDGVAVVTAAAPGLRSDPVKVRFSFPFLLAALAALGGAAGHLVLPRGRRGGLKSAARSAVTGVVVGVLFYGVASLHAFKEGFELPLPVNLARIATGTELGALVLGLLGGILGTALWRPAAKGGGQESTERAAARPRAT